MTKFLYHRRTHSLAAAAAAPPAPEAPPERAEASAPLAVVYAESPEAPGWGCAACGKSFSKAAQLARHQRFVHRLERRHQC
ncbi:ZN574 protein, partial [Piaya cayana]|nr:ZN574 protein [Piaya cayana]